MKTHLLILLSLFAGIACAQKEHPWEEYLRQTMTQEDAESPEWEQTYELLCELEDRPLDINTVTREQLEELPFLSARQIEGIMEYQWRYGPLKSLGELQMVRQLDYVQRKLLSFFVRIGTEEQDKFPSLQTIAKYGQHELTGMVRVPCYERKGDQSGYLGPPYRHWLRYQFTHGDEVKAGLVASQDAGEPFFAGRNRWGYDYYSYYLQLRNLGRLETVVLGNYRVSMGMGLVMNNSFSLGKIATLQQLGRSSNTIRAHSSRTTGALRGGAATVGLSRCLKLTAFFSYSPADATLNKDSTAATLLTSGYHRTASEMAKKNNMDMMRMGGSLRWSRHGFHLGVNALYNHLSRELAPNTTTLYRRHYPQGTDFVNLSLDYGMVKPRLAVNGETATDKKGHIATINSLSLELGESLRLLFLQRFYSYRYTALDAMSFSDGGRVQNESGCYLGLTWTPFRNLRFTAYTDYAYFAWAKYQISQSSYSWDHLLQCFWQLGKWNLEGRYRLRLREKDNSEKTALVGRSDQRGRLSLSYADSRFSCRTQLDISSYGMDGAREWGTMVSQNLAYAYHWLRLNAGIGYFNTDSYDSRMSLYEQAPLYTYSLVQCYGEGIRYWLMVRAAVGSRLALTAKLSLTNYFDRSVIGSGLQQVGGSSMADVDLQVRWKI